jgi:hypothetical protein
MGCKKFQEGGRVPDVAQLIQSAGGVGQLGSQVGIARGETPGALDVQALAGMSPAQLAELDRFVQGAVFSQTNPLGFAGLPVGAGIALLNEGSKAVPGVQDAIAQFLGEPQFETDPSSSPASLGNVIAFIKGALSGVGGERFATDQPQAQTGIRGEQGGMVPPGKFTMRVPTNDLIQSFQSGGLVGDIVSQLQNVNIPQLGQVDATAKQLGQFDPFAASPLGGIAQGTLGGMLETGMPVDVAPITDVAQARAARTFEDLSGSINEQMGALGLGSSSARAQALAREASRAAQTVGETGILAGVGAEEAARGRQMQAFNPFLGASGQQLSGRQSAGGLHLGAGGLNLASQVQPAQVLAGLAGNVMPALPPQINRPPQQAPPPRPPPPPRQWTGGALAAPSNLGVHSPHSPGLQGGLTPLSPSGGKSLTQHGGKIPTNNERVDFRRLFVRIPVRATVPQASGTSTGSSCPHAADPTSCAGGGK